MEDFRDSGMFNQGVVPEMFLVGMFRFVASQLSRGIPECEQGLGLS